MKVFEINYEGNFIDLEFKTIHVYCIYTWINPDDNTHVLGITIWVKEGKIYDIRRTGSFAGLQNFESSNYDIRHINRNIFFDFLKSHEDITLKLIENYNGTIQS